VREPGAKCGRPFSHTVYSHRESSCQQKLVVLLEIRQVFSVLDSWTKLLPARVIASIGRGENSDLD